MKPSVEEETIIEIGNLGVNGEGVGRISGFTYFVEGALPGEKVRVRITEVRTTYARALPIEFLTLSPHRTAPPCPLFGKCGGCQIMHLTYPEQLKAKQQRVKDALERIGKINISVEPCLPSPQPLAYRNKIQLPVDQNLRLGLYARNTHAIIPIEQCFIHSPLGEEVFSIIHTLLKKHASFGKNLKHVLIKTALYTQEALVVLITHNTVPLLDFAKAIVEKAPCIKGIVQYLTPTGTNTILGKEVGVLSGRGWIEEQLCKLRFRISPASFFQVNPGQAEVLYQTALNEACLTGNEKVVDAYCGVGTLSLFFAGQAKEVIGIESVTEATRDAQENAKRNHIKNAKFIHGKAEETIASLGNFDVALLNPPRKGCDSALLDSLVKNKASRIIYISCDPATLARDLKFLVEKGYRLEKVQPVDMFPQTMHVESIATLKTAEN